MARICTIWRILFSILIALTSVVCSQSASAQYAFVQDTDNASDWIDVARWTDGGSNNTFPDAVGATVTFNQPIRTGTGVHTITLPTAVSPDPLAEITVGEITMNNAGFSNTTRTTITGGKLVFQKSSGSAKYTETLNAIAVAPANFQNQILSTVEVASDLIIDQNNYQNLNTGTIFGGLINGASNRTITKAGVGGIQFNYGFALETGEGFQGQYLIQQGTMRLINSNAALQKSTGVTVSAGGQLQLAENTNTQVTDYGLATGAVLNLNGNGATATLNNTNTGGALRFGIAVAGRTMTFHSPVVLQSDSTISANAADTTSVIDNVISGPGDLTKGGAGKLSLTGVNTYTGDTRINNATLSITNAYLADTADVYLATGGIFDLAFAATDTVRSLYFDGLAQAVGTYGATGSGATFINDTFFKGTGVLNVTSLPVMGVPGDFNNNGVVDSADYVLWRKGSPLQNEVSDTGVVNAQDYTDWRARFGNTSGSGSGNSAVVPEPAAAALIVFAMSAYMIASRKR